jgi:DNA repair ATPase RecN
VAETGIAAQDKTSQSIKDLGIATTSVKGMPELAHEVKITAGQVADLAQVGQRIARIKGRARGQVQEGLREIDRANRKIEKYAELSTLRRACSDWDSAKETITSSKSTLSSLPSFPKSHQRQIADALVKSDRAKVNNMLSKIAPHVRRARSELSKAERQERTVAGRAKRTVGRFFNRAKKKISNSRIGREVTVSFKTMVLGTKIFYDMMEMDSNTDMMGWAMKYEGDMNQLMNEVEEVNNMEGWSLTGKNTFVEGLTDKAYEESFHKK